MNGVYYDLGRLTRVLINFDPVETASFGDTVRELLYSDNWQEEEYLESEYLEEPFDLQF